MLNKLILFTVTKILAAVTKYLFKIMILALCLYGQIYDCDSLLGSHLDILIISFGLKKNITLISLTDTNSLQMTQNYDTSIECDVSIANLKIVTAFWAAILIS